MNPDSLRDSLARFFSLLTAMLVAMSLYYGIESVYVSRPIMVPLDPPFKICVGYTQVKPGGTICYHVKYFKRLDIPGDIIKQLIVIDRNTGKKVYLPLETLAGHLPAGKTEATAYAHIPVWAPEGKARIKLSSAHFTGRTRQFATVLTEEFEIVK